MTRIVGDPGSFMEDAMTGFVALYERYLSRVPGGVVRRERRPGKVAVVVGGGSGHYPAFCGVVGPGFADGAVVGDIFTSPSTSDAVSVSRDADNGGGVLLITGNYAGDVINFTNAARQLSAEGIETEYLVVTDDVASAPADERDQRRGIAGDFIVFKAASAAAEEGAPLAQVTAVARLANDRTRSLGVAFDGCRLPGADAPLFRVPAGRMALGLGIHGEPGIDELDLPVASRLAEILVDGVLADRPDVSDSRVAVVLNGLGATKYEELFGLWGHVQRRLTAAGLTLVEPEVGELVTSLDMEGCSLTLTWLDPLLERLWRAPVDTPAYRKGTRAGDPNDSERSRPLTSRSANDGVGDVEPPVGDPAVDERAEACAARAVTALGMIAEVMRSRADEFGALDAVAGDGDHGRGMVRGSAAAHTSAARAQADGGCVATVLRAAGMAWATKAGGTSGALWGEMLQQFAGALPQHPQPPDIVRGASAAMDGIARVGGACIGDKTMLDALAPFVQRLASAVDAGTTLAAGWSAAATAAENAARRSASLRPRVGRARPLADRSVGSPDPGAVSLAAALRAVADELDC